jgi:hypothetical protein
VLALLGSACTDLGQTVPPPSVSSAEVNLIASDPEGIWPGGASGLPDGGFYVVYERKDPTAMVFGRAMPDLLGPPGTEERIAGAEAEAGQVVAAFDPGVAITASGATLVSWANTGFGVFLQERASDGSFTPPVQLAPKHFGQASLAAADGATYVVFNYIPPGDEFGAHFDNQVLVQRVTGVTEHEPAVLAGGPAGSGTNGNQFRVSLSGTGLPGQLIVVWNRPSDPPGGDRTIWAAISTDAGSTWGQPFPVAAVPGDDLVNPFAVEVGFAGELRVYFVNRRGGGGSSLNVVTSSDNGRTWGPVTLVPQPEGVRNAPARPVLIEVGGRLVCLASWQVDGVPTLGTFVVS